MRKPIVIAVVTLMLVSCVAALAAEKPKFDKEKFLKEGFVPLFNGKDFKGWKVPQGDNGHWKVVDGVIDYDAQSEFCFFFQKKGAPAATAPPPARGARCGPALARGRFRKGPDIAGPARSGAGVQRSFRKRAKRGKNL